MADIRIKDITTTASASLTGDFLPIDGTTGTRKLSAFSPTFGGNATVTGTLTANGGATVGGGSFAAASFYKSSSLGSVLSGATGSSYDLYITNPAGNYILQVPTGTRNAEFAGTLTTVGNATVGAALTVQATTASTTTSTGALVVGNGTSGGLGVGGSICLGANIVSAASDGKFQITGTGNTTGTKELTFQRADGGDSTAFGLTGSAYAGVLTGLGNNEAYLYTSNAFAFRIFIGTAATNRFDFTNSQFKINPTTASTSTSSGALVVSGGVGVAGAVNVGGSLGVTGTITVSGDQNSFFSGSWPRMNFTTNGSSVWLSGATTGAATIQHDFQNRSTTSLLALYGTGNAVFAGNIKTAAPAGGTAAEWKLGTVATVSPTSPNRTIEVDIGGTIYYIHAKTTNN